MELTHIEHIGIAVKNIEEQLPYYEGVLGLKCYNIETVEDQKVKTAFFMIGQTKIELLEPTSEESTIAKFPVILSLLEQNDMTPNELYAKVKKSKVKDIAEFVEVLPLG